MSLPYTRTFNVRFQECNVYGIVDSTHFLYYIQETFMAHAAEFGYTFESELEKGRGWLIRETEVKYLRPLRYGDTVSVTMKMADLRPATFLRTYDLNVQRSGKRSARAQSEFVAVNTSTQRPIPIPKEVVETFFPGGIPQQLPPRRKFPKAPTAPEKIFRTRKRVEWRDLDMQGHVNNCTYLSYMETAAQENGEAIGWPLQRFLDQNLADVAQWSRFQYLGQAAVGDELEISTYLSDLDASSYIRHDTMKRVGDESILTRGLSRHVYADLDSLRPRSMPKDFLAALDGYVVKTKAA